LLSIKLEADQPGLKKLTLAGFHPWIGLVDHVNTTLPSNDATVLVALFGRFQRISDFHDTGP